MKGQVPKLMTVRDQFHFYNLQPQHKQLFRLIVDAIKRSRCVDLLAHYVIALNSQCQHLQIYKFKYLQT